MSTANASETTYRDIALIGAVAIVSIFMLGQLHFAPRAPQDAVAVIFPPWTRGGSAIETAVAAGASILRVGRYPFIAVVRPDDARYTDRVIATGAWLVLDPEIFGGCLTHDRSQP